MRNPSVSMEELRELFGDRQPPFLSLYLPTHRRHPENQQDPIRYKNLLNALEESVLQRHSTVEARSLLEPFRALAEDRNFWNHTWDGLAVLGATGVFRVIQLHRPVPELAIAADSIHVKPLLRILQLADRYQVLCLNRRKIQLFEGNRDHLDEVALAGEVPSTLSEALGDELREPDKTVTFHGGARLGSGMQHGQGTRQDELDVEQERFFRAVDRPILEHHSRPSGFPLILAALAEYHALFRRVSRNPFLMSTGIEMDTGSLTTEQLCRRAWAIVEPEYRARLRTHSDAFEEHRADGLGSDDLVKVAQAAAESRVESLLVEAERKIPGRLDPSTGEIQFDRLEDPQVDDLLDDLAELVLRRGGKVVVVPALDMPVTSGVAAIFRF